jgi:DNA-binding NarL/FixJ family response regulator
MLTTFDLDEYVYDALKAGASGFLLKDAPSERLLAFVRSAGDGDALLDPTITRRLIERYARTHPAGPAMAGPLSALTPRELEVLAEVARGRSNAEIAAAMRTMPTPTMIAIPRTRRRPRALHGTAAVRSRGLSGFRPLQRPI